MKSQYSECWSYSGLELSDSSPWGLKGVFTTLSLSGENPQLLFWEDHWERLENSLTMLGFGQGLDNIVFVRNKALEFIENQRCNYQHLLRIALTEEAFSLDIRSIGTNIVTHGLEGHPIPFTRNDPSLKSLLDEEIYGQLKNVKRNEVELLLISPAGNILEGLTSNLAFVLREKVIIPQNNTLPGITCFYLTKLFKEIGIIVAFEDVHSDDLQEVKEILVCGSGRGISFLNSIPENSWKQKGQEVFDQVSQAWAIKYG